VIVITKTDQSQVLGDYLKFSGTRKCWILFRKGVESLIDLSDVSSIHASFTLASANDVETSWEAEDII
jgi:hypothetical protein